MKRPIATLFTALLLAATYTAAAHAQSDTGTPTEGEIRRVDKANGKLTIRHGPIRNLDMPGMTMVFRVTDTSALEKLAPGDRIRFHADKEGSAYTASQIEAAPAAESTPKP